MVSVRSRRAVANGGKVKGAKRRARKRKRNYGKESVAAYIYGVMKEFHPDFVFSSEAIAVVFNFVLDFLERIGSESFRLAIFKKRSTITRREIDATARLMLPGVLAKYAASDGFETVTENTSTA